MSENLTSEHFSHSEHEDYKLLVGFNRSGNIVSGEALRREYALRTIRFVEEIHDSQPDAVIFLDKSARPVSWLMRAFWKKMIPDEHMPKTYFLNIDRELWRDEVGSNLTGRVNGARVDQSRIDEVHALFLKDRPHDNGAGDILDEHIMLKPTTLDGKRVVVVDEVRATGDTLDIAKAIIGRALPKSEVTGKYWMVPRPNHIPGGGTSNAEVPVWYSSATVSGRGVDNRDSIGSARSSNPTQRIGRWFLSTRFSETDRASESLRQEINWLAEDSQELIDLIKK